MIRLWDFECEHCGKDYPNQAFTGSIPSEIPCECGKRATWDYNRRSAQIHPTASGRKYGEYDPQFGCVVEDYAHKQQLLKEMNMEEIGPVSREQVEEESWEAQNRERPGDASEVLAADSIEEIYEETKKHSQQVREGQLQESWVEL